RRVRSRPHHDGESEGHRATGSPRSRTARPRGGPGAGEVESGRGLAKPQGQLQDTPDQDRRVWAHAAQLTFVPVTIGRAFVSTTVRSDGRAFLPDLTLRIALDAGFLRASTAAPRHRAVRGGFLCTTKQLHTGCRTTPLPRPWDGDQGPAMCNSRERRRNHFFIRRAHM